jgi:hypothetical protein
MASEFIESADYTQDHDTNVAVRAVARGEDTYNFALHGVGHISTEGMAVGWKMNVWTLSNARESMSIENGNKIWVKIKSNTSAVLPTLGNVVDNLKMPRSGDGANNVQAFMVELYLLFVNAPAFSFIYGYEDGGSYGGSAFPPQIIWSDGSLNPNLPVLPATYTGIVKLLLTWEGGDITNVGNRPRYKAFVV